MTTEQASNGAVPRRPIPRIDPPKPIDLTNYCIPTKLTEEPADYQSALLLYTTGDDCSRIFENSGTTDGSVQLILKVLESHCVGDTNIVFQRFKLNSRNQSESEDVDTYVASLRQLAAKCNFKDLLEELVRDRIILGIHCEDTRHRLLSTKGLTLEKMISICRSKETARLTIHNIQKQASDVHKIEKKAQHSVPTIACKYCGKTHQRKKEMCPAWGKHLQVMW